MDEEIKRRLDSLELKLEATYQSAEKTRRYLLWTLIITIVVLVLPLFGLLFAIPSLLSSYSEFLTL